MKRSEIERQLKNDLAASAPSDFASVLARCEREKPVSVLVTEPVLAGGNVGETAHDHRHGGKLRALAVSFAAILFIVLSLVWIFRSGSVGGVKGKPAPFSNGYFVLDINPSVELSYDKNGKITEAAALNDDGEVLLYGTELVGKAYTQATGILFERCLELGYFSAAREDNAILASATSNDGGRDEKMTEQIKTLFSEKFSAYKLRGVVITGVSNPELETEAQKHGVDAQKYALIQSYLALGGALAESEYASITIRELYAKISEKEAAIKEAEKLALEAQKLVLQGELLEGLSEAVEDVLDGLTEYIDRDFGGGAFRPADEHKKHYYESKIEEIAEYAEEIGDARTAEDCGRIVEKIFRSLDGLQKGEPDQTFRILIESAKISIQTLFVSFEEVNKALNNKKATAEEIEAARKDKFDRDVFEEDEDWEDWQEKHEEDFSSSWYDYKNRWQQARERDLDD
ncbi:MAG: hypothetical protein IJY62_01595 [Clostridia bacterium]|nr:hypothetical protein [Clostridia bacterium]